MPDQLEERICPCCKTPLDEVDLDLYLNGYPMQCEICGQKGCASCLPIGDKCICEDCKET